MHSAMASVNWKIQLALFLLPSIFYGVLFLGQHFPKSEASQKGLKLGEMLKEVGVMGAAIVGFFIFLFVKDGLGPLLSGFSGSEFFGFTKAIPGASQAWMIVSIIAGAAVCLAFGGAARWTLGAPLLAVLFITHALVGAVELGTDGWIQNIEGAILTPSQATWLFIFTSAFMFALRFCANFIEKNVGLSPVGILLCCASLACLGLNLVSGITAFGGALGALAVYALGKTFFWPTMLAVASDRFPRCGAVAISIMGGLGMMSAGLVGSPGLGYAKDRFSGEELAKNPAAHAEYKAQQSSQWLFFKEINGIDGQKLEAARKVDANERTAAQTAAIEADVKGNRTTLKADSFIPATMAAIYLCILLYFKAIGGYKPVHIVPLAEQTETKPPAAATAA
jgi:hypothetical protein